MTKPITPDEPVHVGQHGRRRPQRLRTAAEKMAARESAADVGSMFVRYGIPKNRRAKKAGNWTKRDEAASEENMRENLLRLTEAAYRGTTAWAVEGFAQDVRDRLGDTDFRYWFLKRVRPDRRQLTEIKRGALVLSAVLSSLLDAKPEDAP
jgi:hypothetical protein